MKKRYQELKKLLNLPPSGRYRLGVIHSLRMQSASAVRFIANACTLDPDNQIYQTGFEKALQDLPSNMTWNSEKKLIVCVRKNDADANPSIVHPQQRAVQFAKEWYIENGSTYPNVGARGHGMLNTTLPSDVRSDSQRAMIIQANNFLRLGIESAKCHEKITVAVLQQIEQRILQQNTGVKLKTQAYFQLQSEAICEMFPHCMHANLPELGNGITMLANGFNIGGTNCFLQPEQTEIRINIDSAEQFANDMKGAKHPVQYIQQCVEMFKIKVQANVDAVYKKMYGSIKNARKHHRDRDDSGSSSSSTTEEKNTKQPKNDETMSIKLYGYDNIGEGTFVARSPLDTVKNLRARLNKDIAWIQKENPRMSAEKAELEAWLAMAMQVSFAYQTQFVMGSLLTVMGQLETADLTLRWATDFVRDADAHLSPHLRATDFRNFMSGNQTTRGVAFLPSFRRGALIMRSQCQQHLFSQKSQISGHNVDMFKSKMERLALMYRVLYGHHLQEGSQSTSTLQTMENTNHYNIHVRSALSEACGALGSWANSMHPMELESFECGSNPLNIFRVCPQEYLDKELGFDDGIVNYIISSFGCNSELMNGHDAPYSKVNRFALGAQFYLKAGEYCFEDCPLQETYWWGAACCMVQTGLDRDDYGTGPWTMGELREVVRKARRAQQTLDTAIYIHRQKMHTPMLEAMVFHVLSWFEKKEDTFAIPACSNETENKTFSCVLADGKQLVADLTKESKKQNEMFTKVDKALAVETNDAATCSSSFVDEYPAGFEDGCQDDGSGAVPRLDMIALRKLHMNGRALNCADPSDIFDCMIKEENTLPCDSVNIDPMSFCALCGDVPNNRKLLRCVGF